MRAVLLLVAFLALATPALAQPAGVGNPHEGVSGAPQTERSLAVAIESRDIPAGTIAITVVDQAGQPIPNAEVALGVMAQGGTRERRPGATDAEGHARFEGLPTGTTQAYRVNVPFEGALYSTTPFRLSPDIGYRVRITRLPVTRDAQVLLQLLGVAILELRENRVRVMQQTRLMNLGDATYVFPENGLFWALPREATSPQVDPVMTDQRLVPTEGGMKLMGSLPPGVVTLSFSYDVPVRDSKLELSLSNPFRTYVYRVVSDAPNGSSLAVAELPAPQAMTDEGRRLFVTQIEKGPQDPLLTDVRITLRDLPSPGPLRWIALGLAAAFIAGFTAFSARRKRTPGASTDDLKTKLLAEIRELDAELSRGEIGPQYHATKRDDLMNGLAEVLRDEATP